MSNEYVHPEVEPYHKDECPICGQDPSRVEIYAPDPFSPDYEYGVDQEEVYYSCDDCKASWRLAEE